MKRRTYHACNAPDIGPAIPITTAKDSLRRAILTGLDLLRVMFLRRCCISQIGNLDGDRRWNDLLFRCSEWSKNALLYRYRLRSMSGLLRLAGESSSVWWNKCADGYHIDWGRRRRWGCGASGGGCDRSRRHGDNRSCGRALGMT